MVKKEGRCLHMMIFEMGSDNRRLEFHLVRSSFNRAIDEIDNAVNDLKTNHQLKYSYHRRWILRLRNSGLLVRRHQVQNLFKIYLKFIKNLLKIITNLLKIFVKIVVKIFKIVVTY